MVSLAWTLRKVPAEEAAWWPSDSSQLPCSNEEFQLVPVDEEQVRACSLGYRTRLSHSLDSGCN